MKLAVNLINFGPGATPDSLEGWVHMAQRLGYHGLLTSDHRIRCWVGLQQ